MTTTLVAFCPFRPRPRTIYSRGGFSEWRIAAVGNRSVNLSGAWHQCLKSPLAERGQVVCPAGQDPRCRCLARMQGGRNCVIPPPATRCLRNGRPGWPATRLKRRQAVLQYLEPRLDLGGEHTQVAKTRARLAGHARHLPRRNQRLSPIDLCLCDTCKESTDSSAWRRTSLHAPVGSTEVLPMAVGRAAACKPMTGMQRRVPSHESKIKLSRPLPSGSHCLTSAVITREVGAKQTQNRKEYQQERGWFGNWR